MSVVESAARLFELLAATDDIFTRYLGLGLAEDRIREIVAPTGVKLPREAIDFYSRLSLTSGYPYSADQPSLCGIYWMLSLGTRCGEYAAQKREGRYQSAAEIAAGSEGWFPLLQEDAGNRALQSRRGTLGRPIESLRCDTRHHAGVATRAEMLQGAASDFSLSSLECPACLRTSRAIAQTPAAARQRSVFLLQ